MTSRYHTIFNLLALSIVIYIGVGVFYRIVGARLRRVDTKTLVVQHIPDDKGHQERSQDDYRLIIDRNMFGSTDKAHGEVNAEEIDFSWRTTTSMAMPIRISGITSNSLFNTEHSEASLIFL